AVKYANNTTIFINDDVRDWKDRVSEYLQLSCENQAIVIKEVSSYNLADFLNEEDLTDRVKLISELPKSVKAKQKREAKKTAKAVKLTGSFDYAIESVSWQDAEVDLDDGGIYVEVNRYKWHAGLLSNDDFMSP